MTMNQLHRLKPLLNLRLLCEAAGLSYDAVSSKLYRFGAQGRRSELTVPEGAALDRALARLLAGAGLHVDRPSALNDPTGEGDLIVTDPVGDDAVEG